MGSWRAWFVTGSAAASAAVLAVFGCTSDYAGTTGGEGDSCYPNGTCDPGLTCLSSHCVRTPDGEAPAFDGGGFDAADAGLDAGDAALADADGGAPPVACSVVTLAALPQNSTVLFCSDFEPAGTLPSFWKPYSNAGDASAITVDDGGYASARGARFSALAGPYSSSMPDQVLNMSATSGIPNTGSYSVSFEFRLDTPTNSVTYPFEMQMLDARFFLFMTRQSDGGDSAQWLDYPTAGAQPIFSDAAFPSLGAWHHVVIKVANNMATAALDGTQFAAMPFTRPSGASGLELIFWDFADVDAGSARVMHLDNVAVTAP